MLLICDDMSVSYRDWNDVCPVILPKGCNGFQCPVRFQLFLIETLTQTGIQLCAFTNVAVMPAA